MTTSSQDLVSHLIELSNQIGADTEYTRSGGGNSSAKIGDTLLIKPSGVPLATLREEDLVPLDIPCRSRCPRTTPSGWEHPRPPTRCRGTRRRQPGCAHPSRCAGRAPQRGPHR
ncbi:class II aldolase/adducin family protein [Actinomyces bouchesdurhonensis]|uniref:class II aldolase/adducin family protein n=1 Tax=Actinomyces bouchesdurhonensis TaxID=1852361 RepID=UPI001F20DADE|nr:class II aldolase/adducin family protein [Actinomyces bouchesdurhonensis]